MKKLTLLLVLISTFTFAQQKITTKLGDFNELKVFNGLTVELEKSNESKIEISGSQSEDVSIKNANGILKIRLKFPESFTAEDVRIVLFYSENIDILDANEGATILSEATIKQQHLEVKVQEGAKINIPVDTKHLTIKAVSGGIIELSGVTQNQNVEATTGGIYEGYNLQSKQSIVTAASGARVEVKTTEILDAKVRFGGTIHYKGNPEVLKTKKIIGGVIKHRN
ncbi:putative autotransporter adhesin-like protein [Lutibacter oceani]|uniref:Putative autotransporter adhesin-like protein n=1 Tax=Lutibacter oceani TaxID=1853311 RepID=A0A3D9S0H0_9FLAO|nr:head GIN domain-containing protein [Lutibacter oceani]REE83631.1 putative autotransporter adhesin-like protein [Lutibacter oceani]